MADTDIPAPDKDNPAAPFGYEADGTTPKAPYGWKADGDPRLSRRGRTGTRKATPTATATQGRGADAARARAQRDNLLALADAVVSPLMAGATSDGFAKRVGQPRADGIAGALVIVDGFLPTYADHIVAMAASRPTLLSWMDKVDDKAPWLALGIVTAQALKSVAEQIARPDPRLAEAARLKVRVRNAQLAELAQAEARRMGITLPGTEQARPHPETAGAAA